MFIAYQMLRTVLIWKRAPFLRFLVPMMGGIVVQWHSGMPVSFAWWAFSFSLMLLTGSFLLSGFWSYKLRTLNGIAVILVFFSFGSLVSWYKDIRHDANWFGNSYKIANVVVATLKELPAEKPNSYKATAAVTAIMNGQRIIRVKGKIIIYFKKDLASSAPEPGSQIIFSNSLQEISNSGNPAGFDYKRYSLFQGITHQVYLKEGDFRILKEREQTVFGSILFPIRRKVLSILRENIAGEKERGLGEALLIGYKDDLDKTLVQSYTNTGVVHVIAISGLHLGLIYWLLVQLIKPFRKKKASKWLSPSLIISGLWLFSFVAGGQPSVLRSALMFTCVVLAENFSRRSSIYNSLAFSAFVLLCMNPYWLWDVGFQLSYAAVLSILIFMKPIYNWFYIRNKVLDLAWKLNAVSIAAQLLTTPLSIYHFHQFPNYFLLTNFVSVPLSSIIVLGEIVLCSTSFIPFLGSVSGKIISRLIWLMNSYIERVESLPYSLWDGLQINIIQAGLLVIVVTGIGHWFMNKQKTGGWTAISALSFFVCLRSYSFYRSDHQQEFIIYNVPHHRAIDIITGRKYFFIGDSDLLLDEFARNFHMRPSRVLHRARPDRQPSNLIWQKKFLQYNSKRVLLLDQDFEADSCAGRIPVDLLVISKNPRLYLLKLAKTFQIRQVVFDSSTPGWKTKYWKKDCDALQIPYYDVSEKGAFVMKLN